MVDDQNLLDSYIKALARVFRRARSRHDAHRASVQILCDMAGDPRCIRAALAREIRRGGSLNTRHHPAVGMTVAHTIAFGLVLNAFLPAPVGQLDTTANSIHHHGHLLLTTVTSFGPGYEHWRFTEPKPLDVQRELFSMRLVDRQRHHANHIAFVDAEQPHAVVMPEALTLTFALWSSKHPTSWRDHVKRLRVVRRREAFLRRIAARFRLSKALGINRMRYFDFYPTPDGFKGMRERVQFQRGPNEDFLCSFFHILQETRNEELAGLIHQAQLRTPPDSPRALRGLLEDLRAGRKIHSRYSAGLHWLEHMNFPTSAIEQTLRALDRRRSHDATQYAAP